MTTAHLDVLERAVHDANAWLNDLMEALRTDDRHLAYNTLRASLHALRDRIGPQHAVRLGAQLPLLIRGLFYEGWHLAAEPSKERRLQSFLEHVSHDVHRGLGADPQKAVAAAYEVLCKHIDRDEALKLVNLFPEELRPLWPERVRTRQVAPIPGL